MEGKNLRAVTAQARRQASAVVPVALAIRAGVVKFVYLLSDSATVPSLVDTVRQPLLAIFTLTIIKLDILT